MVTIKDLREILIHFQDRKYDDYEVVLWDYNHQQKLDWGGCYGLSHPDKQLSFAVEVPPVDGITVFERLKQLQNVQEENK
jgi:hypothetical protein